MSRPIIKIHNVETGEVNEREMTDAELDVYQKNQLEAEQNDAAIAQKAAERAAILERLGLSEEEAKLLLS